MGLKPHWTLDSGMPAHIVIEIATSSVDGHHASGHAVADDQRRAGRAYQMLLTIGIERASYRLCVAHDYCERISRNRMRGRNDFDPRREGHLRYSIGVIA